MWPTFRPSCTSRARSSADWSRAPSPIAWPRMYSISCPSPWPHLWRAWWLPGRRVTNSDRWRSDATHWAAATWSGRGRGPGPGFWEGCCSMPESQCTNERWSRRGGPLSPGWWRGKKAGQGPGRPAGELGYLPDSRLRASWRGSEATLWGCGQFWRWCWTGWHLWTSQVEGLGFLFVSCPFDPSSKLAARFTFNLEHWFQCGRWKESWELW